MEVVESVKQAWEFPVIVDGQGVGIGWLLLGITLLILAVPLSRRLTKIFSKRVLTPLEINLGAAGTIEALFFYAVLTVTVLFALDLAHVPMTAFAMFGGALAIGVGFGSQTLIANFISGLIMMIEQPVKRGDLVEVSGTYGVVEHIGPRSTWVRTPDNTHIVVPNSFFLQEAVSNWTLNDHRVRCKITIGVAYGTDVEQVKQALEELASGHDEILQKPQPFVLFAAFGESSLDFELIYWLNIHTFVLQTRIASDLRFAIAKRFAAEKIIIAYPQRDLHIDTLQPLQIEMINTPR